MPAWLSWTLIAIFAVFCFLSAETKLNAILAELKAIRRDLNKPRAGQAADEPPRGATAPQP